MHKKVDYQQGDSLDIKKEGKSYNDQDINNFCMVLEKFTEKHLDSPLELNIRGKSQEFHSKVMNSLTEHQIKILQEEENMTKDKKKEILNCLVNLYGNNVTSIEGESNIVRKKSEINKGGGGEYDLDFSNILNNNQNNALTNQKQKKRKNSKMQCQCQLF